MEFIGFWVLLSIVVGVAASSRDRSGFGWFVLALLISPLIAGLLVLALGRPAVARSPYVDETGQTITGDTHVRCPDCRELVRKDARKCKHCGTALIPQ